MEKLLTTADIVPRPEEMPPHIRAIFFAAPEKRSEQEGLKLQLWQRVFHLAKLVDADYPPLVLNQAAQLVAKSAAALHDLEAN